MCVCERERFLGKPKKPTVIWKPPPVPLRLNTSSQLNRLAVHACPWPFFSPRVLPSARESGTGFNLPIFDFVPDKWEWDGEREREWEWECVRVRVTLRRPLEVPCEWLKHIVLRLFHLFSISSLLDDITSNRRSYSTFSDPFSIGEIFKNKIISFKGRVRT